MNIVSILEQLDGFGLFTVLIIFCLVVLGIIFAAKTFIEARDLFGKSHRQLKDEQIQNQITDLITRVSTLEASAKKFNEDRVHDREQSRGYQNQWIDVVHEMSEKQDRLIERVDALAEQNRKYQLADIRETLLQAYRYYTSDSVNKLLGWTELEKHAWNEQYDVYVENRGNGYMQNTVKPEMDQLRVIQLDDYEAMAELMASRTQNKN